MRIAGQPHKGSGGLEPAGASGLPASRPRTVTLSLPPGVSMAAAPSFPLWLPGLGEVVSSCWRTTDQSANWRKGNRS
jgi:hypothetical protein